MSQEKEFTPALGIGNSALTPLYDSVIGLLTRENTWRSALLTHISPKPGDRILDVGCGTGSLAIGIKLLCGESEVIGIDPDKEILMRAEAKSKKNSANISFHQGFLTTERATELGLFSTVVSSLVFHQTSIEEKRNILVAISKLLQPHGRLCIADYGLQRTKLMRTLFRKTVQAIDGRRDTQPNADGCMPKLIEEAGFINVSEAQVISTLTGSISIYTANLAR